ncbi:unnamed protein product [Cylicocyclus nassatus]|uniref:Uncharacterized protein n=1 Tax=Cylicocyclus nassatus TaxID=53992 RepID=A0AA36GMK5_CYLNA|nr:unnamed protein product [Cylicocyclus nassatus]
MEVDERPSEQYSDIGGCDKQIQELIEAVVPPMTHKDCFVNLGFHPPKGVLLYGPPGAKRFDSEKAGDREVQRTMLELLNRLDGFQPNDEIKHVRQWRQAQSKEAGKKASYDCFGDPTTAK